MQNKIKRRECLHFYCYFIYQNNYKTAYPNIHDHIQIIEWLKC
jgi:hypothetical protein